MFPVLRGYWFFLDLVVLFLSSFDVFRFSFIAWQIFRAKYYPYIVTVNPVLGYNFFLYFANSLMSSMNIRWLVIFCDSWYVYPPVNFQSIWFSGVIAIINSKGDSASYWKITLWIFISVNLFPPAVYFHFPVLHGFLEKIYDFIAYFGHFETV